MKIFFRVTAAVIATILLTSSCTKSDKKETFEEKAEQAFNKWMELNVNKNGVIKAEKQENGMYVEWLKHAPEGAPAPQTGDWLMLNYRGMNFTGYNPETGKGDIFTTRHIEDARLFVQEASDTAYTHYVPQYMLYSNSSGMMYGQYAALKLMKKGDKVRLYLPEALASGGSELTTDNGYGGQMSQSTTPIVFEMELADIVEDPITREQRIVRDIAVKEWQMLENDTVRANLYCQILDYVEGSDTVGKDSVLTLHLAGKFAEDNFVFETNIDSIANRFRRTPFLEDTRYESYYVNFTHFRAAYDFLDDAFKEVIEAGLITYGCRFRMVFTSEYGDGNAEKISYVEPYTVVQKYTPLIYEVYVEPYKDEDEDDD